MFDLAIKLFPYSLVLFGMMLVCSATSVLVSPRVLEPTEMSIDEIEITSRNTLPEWVQVKHPNLHWEAATTIFKEKGSFKIEEKLLVPLVGSDSQAKWGRHENGRETLLIVSIPWSKVKSDFPKIASAASINGSGTELGEEDLVQFDELSFQISKTDPLFMSALEEGIVQQWETVNGFRDSVLVEIDSKPLSAGDGWFLLAIGGLTLVGGGFWVRKRWKRKETDLASELQLAAGEGFAIGLSAGVKKGVEEALSR